MAVVILFICVWQIYLLFLCQHFEIPAVSCRMRCCSCPTSFIFCPAPFYLISLFGDAHFKFNTAIGNLACSPITTCRVLAACRFLIPRTMRYLWPCHWCWWRKHFWNFANNDSNNNSFKLIVLFCVFCAPNSKNITATCKRKSETAKISCGTIENPQRHCLNIMLPYTPYPCPSIRMRVYECAWIGWAYAVVQSAWQQTTLVIAAGGHKLTIVHSGSQTAGESSLWLLPWQRKKSRQRKEAAATVGDVRWDCNCSRNLVFGLSACWWRWLLHQLAVKHRYLCLCCMHIYTCRCSTLSVYVCVRVESAKVQSCWKVLQHIRPVRRFLQQLLVDFVISLVAKDCRQSLVCCLCISAH